eukprot:UN14110
MKQSFLFLITNPSDITGSSSGLPLHMQTSFFCNSCHETFLIM